MFKKNNIKKIKNKRFKISKKMILIILPVVVILGVITLITTGSLSKLMGSSITSYHCIDDTWKLEGTTCSKTTTKKAELFADINLDSKIDNSDLELLNYYIENNNKVDYTILSNIQLVLADINGDGTINNFDSGMLEYYITNPDKQSKDMVCEKGFKLNGPNCELEENIPAEVDDNSVGASNDQIVSFGFADFQKIRIGSTDVYIQYDKKNNKYFLDYGDNDNKTRVNVLTNSLEALKNEKEGYLAASNAFFTNCETFHKSIGKDAGYYVGLPENNVYVSPCDAINTDDVDYYKAIIMHEFGHSIDHMNDYITEKGGITSLSYNNQSFNDYYNKYKLNNLCGGKRCLRDYSYENTAEFWADLFSYDSQALDIDNNLLSLRTKMLEIYSNNYSNNKNKFNKIKADNQNIYVINYDSGTGTGITAIQTAVYNKTISLRSNSFYKEGNSFKGWHAKRSDGSWLCYTDKNKNKKNVSWTNESVCKQYDYYLYSDNEQVTGLAGVDDYVTMYAQWKSNVGDDLYTINYVDREEYNAYEVLKSEKVPYGNTVLAPFVYNSKEYFTGWHAKRDDNYGYCYANFDKTSSDWYNQKTCDLYGYVLLEDQQYFWNADRNHKSFILEAQYEYKDKEVFSVYFDGNGATKGSMKSFKVSADVGCRMNSLPSNEFENKGYGFLGWYADTEDGRGYCYTSYDKTDAAWSDKNACSRFGHKLINNHSSNGRAGICEVNNNVILKAQWANTFTLKFDGNGATKGSMKDQEIVYGVPTSITHVGFEKKGYVFLGWNAKRDDGKGYCYTNSAKTKKAWSSKETCRRFSYYLYKDGLKVKDTANIGGYTTMVAVWTNTYTLKFDGNGATSGSVKDQELVYGIRTKIRRNEFKKTGYAFDGWHAERSDGKWYCYTDSTKKKHSWSTKSTCEKYDYYLYKNEMNVTNTAEPGSYTTLHAKWSKAKCTQYECPKGSTSKGGECFETNISFSKVSKVKDCVCPAYTTKRAGECFTTETKNVWVKKINGNCPSGAVKHGGECFKKEPREVHVNKTCSQVCPKGTEEHGGICYKKTTKDVHVSKICTKYSS